VVAAVMYYFLQTENLGGWQSQDNGHYGFSGAKVQHVLQADGMCYSFTCPLRRHDAMVLR
jgi:hypothetical protein